VDNILTAGAALAGIIVVLKILSINTVVWNGITVSSSDVWVIFLLLTIAHIYRGGVRISAKIAHSDRFLQILVLPPKEVAEILHIAAHTVRRWCSQGLIKATMVPGPGWHPTYKIAGDVMDTLLAGK
jgi:hypothetical protein